MPPAQSETQLEERGERGGGEGEAGLQIILDAGVAGGFDAQRLQGG
jgi:hypothetical protein